ncbi:hypothetical protein ACTPD5_21050, partial [Clostridioides difficile]
TVSYDAGKKLGEYTKKYIDEKLGGKSEIAIVTDLKSQIQMQSRINIDYAEEAKDFLWRFYIE